MDGWFEEVSFFLDGFLAGAVFFERTVINLADIFVAIEHSNSCYDARLFSSWGPGAPVV